MSEKISKTNEAWNALFEKYDILSHVDADGSFRITAKQIKEYREPRLMAKFDHYINLPKVFQDNQLAILPVSRKEYEISRFSAYHTFEEEESNSIQSMALPEYIQSLDSDHISSETMAIHLAAAAGIFEDFLGDTGLLPTVSGRMGTENFDFTIDDQVTHLSRKVEVQNAQMEIDAAYEGLQSLALIEAKCDLSDDFLIRQLYYPYRVWQSRLTKDVRPIFFVYSNGIYHLYEYAFTDLQNYNSLVLCKQKNYAVEDTTITCADLQDVLDTVLIASEPEIPFPQANSMERVINLCELLRDHPLSREDITRKYAFDERQTSYYTAAGKYLGFIEKSDGRFSLTAQGRKILRFSYKKRQLAFCRCILSHRVFHETLLRYFKRGELPETEEIVTIMHESHLYQVESEETYRRRASTVKGWINWIVSRIEEN